MFARSSARRLALAPEPEGLNLTRAGAPPMTADHPSFPLCFGTGMEVMAGKGARRCRALAAQAKRSKGRASRAAMPSAHYRTTIRLVTTARDSAPSTTSKGSYASTRRLVAVFY